MMTNAAATMASRRSGWPSRARRPGGSHRCSAWPASRVSSPSGPDFPMLSFFDLILLLYPASFRREYGGEMRAVFARRLAAAGGAGGRLVVFTEELIAAGRGAAGAHWDILRHDLRAAVRTFAHSPGFAFTAVAVTA